MEGQATEDGTANEQQTEGVTGISPHQNPEAASGAPTPYGNSAWHNSAHPSATAMAQNLVNSDPMANFITEIEQKLYPSL